MKKRNQVDPWFSVQLYEQIGKQLHGQLHIQIYKKYYSPHLRDKIWEYLEKQTIKDLK